MRMTRMTNKNWTPLWQLGVILAALCSTAAIPPISPQARAALDRTLGTKGVYVDEESAYTFAFPRTDNQRSSGSSATVSCTCAPVLGDLFTVDASGRHHER